MYVRTTRFAKDRNLKIALTDEVSAAIADADSPSSLIGKNELDLFHGPLADELMGKQLRAFRDGQGRAASWVITPTGWEYWMTDYHVDDNLLHGQSFDVSESHAGMELVRRLDLENRCVRTEDAPAGLPTSYSEFDLSIMRLYLLGYPVEEIAHRMNRTRNAVKYHIKKFRRHAIEWDETLNGQHDEEKSFGQVLMESGLGHFLLIRDIKDWFV